MSPSQPSVPMPYDDARRLAGEHGWREKALVYVTRGVDDWLVLEHSDEFPDAGAQVPAGGVEPGEGIVITAGAVFVIDAKRYVDKRPVLRVEGGILRPCVEKLMVGGRDRTKLVDGVLGQVERVRAALGDESIEVSGVLCFIEADWRLIGGFFSTRGVRVVSPRGLSKILDESGGTVDVARVRDRVAAALPVA